MAAKTPILLSPAARARVEEVATRLSGKLKPITDRMVLSRTADDWIRTLVDLPNDDGCRCNEG